MLCFVLDAKVRACVATTQLCFIEFGCILKEGEVLLQSQAGFHLWIEGKGLILGELKALGVESSFSLGEKTTTTPEDFVRLNLK